MNMASPEPLSVEPSGATVKNYSGKSYYSLMFFSAYAFKGQVCVCRTSENCKSLVLQDKCNIEIFLSPDMEPEMYHIRFNISWSKIWKLSTHLFTLTLCLLVLSADNLFKRIGPRSGPTKCPAWSGSKLFDIMIVFLKFSRRQWEPSDSVVECLTQDRGATGSSHTCSTALWSLSKTHLS